MLVWWGKTKLLMVSKLVIVRKKESLKPWLETSSIPPAPPLIFFTHREISRNLHSILHTQVLIVIITFDHSK